MATDVDVVNEALALIGFDGNPVTGSAPSFDTSTQGKIAARIYVPTVRAVARQFEWDFSRNVASLTLSGNSAPFPWAFEYVYPALAVQLWQVTPPSISDPNNPLPVNFVVASSLISGVSTKVVWTNQATPLAVYNGLPPVDVWDAGFRSAVARSLSSGFALGGAGKPELAQTSLEAAGQITVIASERAS